MNRFLAIFCVATVLGIGSIITLNVAVDPFGVWRPDSKPLSAVVSRDIGYSRLVKNHWVRHQNPEIALFGNSHAASAFQARHFQAHLGNGEAFNMALVGASTEELISSMKHVVHVTDARDFIVVLDVLNFRGHDSRDTVATHFHRAEDDSMLSRYFYLRDFPVTTFSRAASARSLLISRSGYPDTHSKYGFFLRCSPTIAGSTQRQVLTAASQRARTFREQQSSWKLAAGTATSRIAELVGFAEDHDVGITFVLPPFNVTYYYALIAADLWDLHLHITAELINAIQASGLEDSPVVMDFSAAHPLTTQTSMQLEDSIDYWLDSDHFNCALAEQIVKRVAALRGQESNSAPQHGENSFGVRVTAESLPAHLREHDEGWKTWQLSHPKQHELLSRRILAE